MGLAERPTMPDDLPIRDAATVIIVRDGSSVLMGQRGSKAVFMPGKFVFPGGAVDAGDQDIPIGQMGGACDARLGEDCAIAPNALLAAAVRELWEETGQIIGDPGDWPDAPPGWDGFAATGHRPTAAPLSFFFRAVTPRGRPRRFDARFFLADAADLRSDPDDFTGAEEELSHLQWVPLKEARRFDLPFITQVVLAELIGHLKHGGPVQDVPFFRNNDEDHLISRLGGASPL